MYVLCGWKWEVNPDQSLVFQCRQCAPAWEIQEKNRININIHRYKELKIGAAGVLSRMETEAGSLGCLPSIRIPSKQERQICLSASIET